MQNKIKLENEMLTKKLKDLQQRNQNLQMQMTTQEDEPVKETQTTKMKRIGGGFK